MTKSLSYVLFDVVREDTSFLEQKPPTKKPKKHGWHDCKLVSLPSSLNQIGKSEVQPGNDIEKMGVTMYYLMSSAMNHIFYQKIVEIFLAVGNLVVTNDEVEHENVFCIIQQIILGPENLLYDASNELLDGLTKKDTISTVIDQRKCQLWYPHSNQFRAILVCLQDFDLDIFGKRAGWDNEEARTWFDPGDLESSHKKSRKG